MNLRMMGAAAIVVVAGSLLSGCNSSQEPSTPTAAPTAPSQSAPPPPSQPAPQQQLVLYFIPLNPSDFSMQAIQESKKRAEENPEDVQALVSLADANFMIQRFDVASEYYEQAIKANQNHLDARLSLSNSYVFLQKPDQALEQLDKILETEQDYPEALYNKGLILLMAKRDTTNAKATWTKLTDTHPNHPLSRQVQGELSRL